MNPQRARLAAEKVLNHWDFIVAADHADWVVTHARELVQQGETERAVELCREALRMNPSVSDGRVLLSALLGEAEDEVTLEHLGGPYVKDGMEIPVTARCEIEDAVDGEPACTVLLLPMGDVTPQLLDHVAFVLQRETGLRTKIYRKTLPLPEATRRRGLLGGPQWEVTPLVEAMSAETSYRQVGGRLQILIVTNADIYMGDANYVFAANADWGSVVSLARISENADDSLLRHRATKLCYGSLLKSLGVPAAGDRRCVTSYSASLSEFDTKGNRPIPTTQRLLDEAIERVNLEWLERAQRGG
jgi:predicted Zn-dependent protease